ncbi:MAG: L-histidine N(alpha)-methyltransferase, partial [Deltaproteobacteria bacterium]
RICKVPEYYVTRTELGLLRSIAWELTRNFENGDLVELGSGANWKIRILLDALGSARRSTTRYVPVDVSETALLAAARQLLKLYPELEVTGVVADFTRDLHQLPTGRSKLVLFFGSTIGNLNEAESMIFLEAVADTLADGDRFILGLDMIKSPEIVEAAYNDSQEITAAFNKNILLVLNRELRATFDPDDFDHLAFFNEDEGRIEMHLRANRRVDVEIRDLDDSILLQKGETIRTEICRKFSRSSAEEMLNRAGLAVARWHTDPKGWFSVAEVSRLGS